MKVLHYLHGDASYTVFLEPTAENLEILDGFFLEENGHGVLYEEKYEKNVGLFTVIPATNDWGTVYVGKDRIILTLNKLHPSFEDVKKKLFP